MIKIKQIFLVLSFFLSFQLAANDDLEGQAEGAKSCCVRCVTTEKGAIATACGGLTLVCVLAAWGGAYGRLVEMANQSCLGLCACSSPGDQVTFSFVEQNTVNSFFPMFVGAEHYNCTNTGFNATLCLGFFEGERLEVDGLWACGKDLDASVGGDLPELVDLE